MNVSTYGVDVELGLLHYLIVHSVVQHCLYKSSCLEGGMVLCPALSVVAQVGMDGLVVYGIWYSVLCEG